MKEEKKKGGETGTYKRSHVKNNTTHLPEKKKSGQVDRSFQCGSK